VPLKPHPTDPDKVVYVPREYDLPAKRQWVGLTDAELADMHATLMVRLRGCYETKDLYKAIEAKLKEKNT
jgi:hypothetical protein